MAGFTGLTAENVVNYVFDRLPHGTYVQIKEIGERFYVMTGGKEPVGNTAILHYIRDNRKNFNRQNASHRAVMSETTYTRVSRKSRRKLTKEIIS